MLFALHLSRQARSAEFASVCDREHKAYLARVAEHIAFAGPLLRDDGQTMVGSLLVIDFVSRDALQDWLADEPFTQAELYAEVRIHAFASLWPQRAGFPPSP